MCVLYVISHVCHVSGSGVCVCVMCNVLCVSGVQFVLCVLYFMCHICRVCHASYFSRVINVIMYVMCAMCVMCVARVMCVMATWLVGSGEDFEPVCAHVVCVYVCVKLEGSWHTHKFVSVYRSQC